MPIKPRYSLLTLLALTAVVAAGAKLWKGPHQANEATSSASEEHYTYMRDWRGDRVIQGVHIQRSWNCLSSEDHRSTITYYRNGMNTMNYMFLHAFPPGSLRGVTTIFESNPLPLTDREMQELNAALEKERSYYRSIGLVPD